MARLSPQLRHLVESFEDLVVVEYGKSNLLLEELVLEVAQHQYDIPQFICERVLKDLV